MADNVIFNDAADHWQHCRSQRIVVVPHAVEASVKLYVFTVQENTVDFVKTHRSLATAAPWTEFDVITGSEFHCNKFGIWYDRWTPFEATDDKIHIIWAHEGSGAGFYYNQWEVSGDTVVKNKVVIETFAGDLPYDTDKNDWTEIVKLDNGDLWCYIFQFGGAGQYFTLWKSTNDGTSWTNQMRVGPTPNLTLAGADAAQFSHILMSPACGTPDNNTPHFIIHDAGNNRIFLATFNGTTLVHRLDIDTDVIDNQAGTFVQMSIALRHGDRVLFLVNHARQPGHASSEIRCHRIDDVSTTSQETDVFDTADLGGDQIATVSLCIDQVRGQLYCGYLRGSGFFAANMKAYFKKSINSALQWQAEVLSTDGGNRDLRAISLPRNVGDLTELSLVGLAVYDDDSNDWLMSDDDSILIGAYAVRSTIDGGGDEQTVDCTTANPPPTTPGGNRRLYLPSGGFSQRSGYPNYGVSGQVWISYFGKSGGTLKTGDKIIGLSSGATGVFAGKLVAAQRILVTSVVPGPNGQIFVPNEIIHKVGDPSISLNVNSLPAPSASLEVEVTLEEI